MDIARIRKKLKKLESHKKQKLEGALGNSDVKDVQIDSGVEESRMIVDAKVETVQRPVKELVETSITELHEDITRAEDVSQEEIEIIVFRIANEEYAVKITDMQEIIKYQKITIVPRSPKFLKGITSIRGKVLPVIDLKERLGLGEGDGKGQKIMVLSSGEGPVGVLVGTISGVFRFTPSELLLPPQTLTDVEKNFIEGIVKINNRFITILKVDEILRIV